MVIEGGSFMFKSRSLTRCAIFSFFQCYKLFTSLCLLAFTTLLYLVVIDPLLSCDCLTVETSQLRRGGVLGQCLYVTIVIITQDTQLIFSDCIQSLLDCLDCPYTVLLYVALLCTLVSLSSLIVY